MLTAAVPVKPILSVGVVAWSAFTMATPLAAPLGPGLLATRAAMGAGEVRTAAALCMFQVLVS